MVRFVPEEPVWQSLSGELRLDPDSHKHDRGMHD